MVKKVLSDYMNYATIHGIGRSKNSPFLLLKVIWVLALCLSLAVICWQVAELYKKFRSVPISTTIEVNTAEQMEFPEIAICNVNSVRYSTLKQDHVIKDLINQASEKYSIDLDVYNTTVDLYGYNYTKYDAMGKGKDIDNDILWYTKEKFKLKIGVLDDGKLKEISQPFEDFIFICSFAGVNCSKKNFIQFRSYDYGYCYTFAPSTLGTIVSEGKMSASGPHFALELMVNIGQDDGVPFVSSTTGVVIVIQHKGHAFDFEDHVFVPTGFEATIGLTQTRKERAPWKGSKQRCNGNENYTLQQCKEDCHNNFISDRCDCLMNVFQFTDANVTIGDLIPCSTDQHYECIQESLREFVEAPQLCQECIPPCKEIYYEKDVSVFTWPSDNFLPILRRIMQSKLPSWNSSSTSRDFVRGNLAMIRIYLKTLTYQTIKEDYSYSTVNFISDIGGQLGLWAGFSILSILEVIELILIICASSVKSSTTNTHKTDVTPISN